MVAISSIERSIITPPGQDVVNTDGAVFRVLQAEENEYCTNCNARIERGGQDVIVLSPPREMTPSDVVLEDESNDAPWHVIDRRGRGNETSSGEDDREVDIFEHRVGVSPGDEVRDAWSNRTDEEEEHESVIDLSTGELKGRTDDSPDNRCSSEDLGGRADETVGLVGGTHIFDIGEHPSLNTKLSSTGEYGCNNLTPEHGTWGNLHVMTELEVRSER